MQKKKANDTENFWEQTPFRKIKQGMMMDRRRCKVPSYFSRGLKKVRQEDIHALGESLHRQTEHRHKGLSRGIVVCWEASRAEHTKAWSSSRAQRTHRKQDHQDPGQHTPNGMKHHLRVLSKRMT